MKKLLIIAVLATMCATAQSQTTNAKDSVPTIYTCKPIPVGFWEKAGVEEATGLLNSPEGERAYDLIQQKAYTEMVGYGHAWDTTVVDKILASPFGEKFKIRIENIFCSQNGLTEYVTNPLVLRIAKKDSVFARKVIGNCLTTTKEHQFYTGMTIAVLGTKQLSIYHQRLVDDFVKVAKNEELLSAYVATKEDSSKEKLWSALMKNPISSSLLPRLFKARPEQSQAIWKKAYDDGICIKTDNAVEILQIDSAIILQQPYLGQVQDHLLNTLNEAQTFSDVNVLVTAVEKLDASKSASRKYARTLDAMLDSFPNKQFVAEFGFKRTIALASRDNMYYSSVHNCKKASEVIASNDFNVDSLSAKECLSYVDNMQFFCARDKFFFAALGKLQQVQQANKNSFNLDSLFNSTDYSFYNLAAFVKIASRSDYNSLSDKEKLKLYDKKRYPPLDFLPRRYFTRHGAMSLVEKAMKNKKV